MKKKKILTQISLMLIILMFSTCLSFATPEIKYDTNGAANDYGPGSELVLWGQFVDGALPFVNASISISVKAGAIEIHSATVNTDSRGLFRTAISVPKTATGDLQIEMKAADGATTTFTKVLGATRTLELVGFVNAAGAYNEASAPKISASTTQLQLAFESNVNYFNNRTGTIPSSILPSLGVMERNLDCFTLSKKNADGSYTVIPHSITPVTSNATGDVTISKNLITLLPGKSIVDDGGIQGANISRKDTVIIRPSGALEPSTTYKLVVDGRLNANHSGTLGDNQTVYFVTAAAESTSSGGGGGAVVEVEKTVTVTEEKATITVTNTQLDTAIATLKAEDAKIISFELTGTDLTSATGDVKEVSLSLTSEQTKLIQENVEKILLNTPFGAITLPSTVLMQGGGDINLVIAAVPGNADAVQITFTGSNGQITSLDDRVQLEFPVVDATKNVMTHDGKLMKNGKIEDGKAKAITKGFSTFSAEQKSTTFTDIDTHWAKEKIEYLAVRDIVSGMEEGIFSPNDFVTRSQFVRMLVNAFDELDGIPARSSNFSDVLDGQWYSNSVNWAAANKIVSGMGNGTFGINRPITRQDMTVIIDKFAQEMQITLDENTALMAFDDDEDIASYAKDSVYKMQQAGIISGMGENMFKPYGNATRAETATIITKLMDAILQ